jgi:hypothetical protein
MHSPCGTCCEHAHIICYASSMLSWRGPWEAYQGLQKGMRKPLEVIGGLHGSDCNMNVYIPRRWSKSHMQCIYIMGHIISKWVKLLSSCHLDECEVLHIICVTPTRRHVSELTYVMWCLMHAESSSSYDIPMWVCWSDLDGCYNTRYIICEQLCEQLQWTTPQLNRIMVIPFLSVSCTDIKSRSVSEGHAQQSIEVFLSVGGVRCVEVWSSKRKSTKTTAPRIPAWSPTVVLTRRHPG